MNRAELLIVWKYLKATRRGVLSFFSSFAVLGIALGVASLIVVIGVMSGFQEELKRRILGFNPHLVVIPYMGEMTGADSVAKRIMELKGVKGARPYIFTKIIVRRKSVSDGIVVKGVEPGISVGLEDIQARIKFGNFELGNRQVVLGVGLAQRLGAFVGDTVVFYGGAESTPIGPAFRTRAFVVSGVFDAGLFDYNENLAFMDARELAQLANMRGVTGVEVLVDDPYKAQEYAKRVANALGGQYRVLSWIQMNYSLFSALKLEKLAMYIILVLIVLVAAFNIITTLTTLAVEKTWEIGVLRSIGMTKSSVSRIFIILGLLLGLLGTSLGTGVGLGIAWIIERFQIIKLPPDVYFIDRLPVLIQASDITYIVAAALAIAFCAALVPAMRAARLQPAQAITKGR